MLLWVPASRRGSAGFHISSCWLEQHGSCLSQSLPACQPDGNERGFINNVTVCASSHVFYVLYCQGFPSHFQGERSHVFQTKSSLALTVPCQTVVIMEQNFKMWIASSHWVTESEVQQTTSNTRDILALNTWIAKCNIQSLKEDPKNGTRKNTDY